MSCGNPHETPCTEVLDRVYGYLDGEIEELDCVKIRQHLDECGPCLRAYGLEESVKRLVAKHCGCDPVPAELRSKVLHRIREIQATIEFAELRTRVQKLSYVSAIHILEMQGHVQRLHVRRDDTATQLRVNDGTAVSTMRLMSTYLIAHSDGYGHDRFRMRLGLRETAWSSYPWPWIIGSEGWRSEFA